MPLPKTPFVVLDTETTGLIPQSDRVVELALQRFENGEKVAEYESLFKPDEKMGPVARVLTRLTDEDLMGAPVFVDEKPKIEKLVEGAVIICQNVKFDLDMLKGEGLDLKEHPKADSAALASIVFPEAQSFSLGYLSALLDLPHEPRHRAMGDVVATVALLEKVWERLGGLPKETVKKIKEYAERGPEGYGGLLADVGGGGKDMPKWIEESSKLQAPSLCFGFGWQASSKKISSSKFQDGSDVWMAVKNLDSTLKEYDVEEFEPLFAPYFLLDPESRDAMLKQESFTADELTLAIKILLYDPKCHRDIKLHISERDVWKGKLACTRDSKAYRDQFSSKKNVILDHRQLLELLEYEHDLAPEKDTHIVIENASMLEDTATRALKWSCATDPLRAAAEGNKELTSFLDAYQMWIEKVRNFQDIRYLVEADLTSRQAVDFRERLDDLISKVGDSSADDLVRERLEDLKKILDPKNLKDRITYIEQFRDGGQSLQSAPFDISSKLNNLLYKKYQTTLVLPTGEREEFVSIIPIDTDVEIVTEELPVKPAFRITDAEMIVDRLLLRVDGKVICLVNSKREIERLCVKFMEPLEEQGITLIGQGLSGGLGRMQSEFQTSGDRVVWMLTPWMFEGVDLPQDFVDHLWIHSMPFDHPNHSVLGRRAEMYGGREFDRYFVPRLMQRLFRLVRTYCKHRKEDGDILLLDQRVKTKNYGERVMGYLGGLTVSCSRSAQHDTLVVKE